MKKAELHNLLEQYLLFRGQGYNSHDAKILLSRKFPLNREAFTYIQSGFLEQQREVKLGIYKDLLERKKELTQHKIKDGEPNLKVYDAILKLDRELEKYLVYFGILEEAQNENKIEIKLPDIYQTSRPDDIL